MPRTSLLSLLCLSLTTFFLTVALLPTTTTAFSLVFMGARRGKGDLKRSLTGDSGKNSRARQEITGVTLPAENSMRGWEFGEGVRLVVANTGGNQYWALQGDCPRCSFDLWRGNLIVDDPGFTDLPAVACPTCSTTYSLKTGKHGPPLKRTGLQAFTSNLAKTATNTDAMKDARAFVITREEEDGKVYCRER